MGRIYIPVITLTMRHCILSEAAQVYLWGGTESQGIRMSSTYVKQIDMRNFSPLDYGILKREHPQPGVL